MLYKSRTHSDISRALAAWRFLTLATLACVAALSAGCAKNTTQPAAPTSAPRTATTPGAAPAAAPGTPGAPGSPAAAPGAPSASLGGGPVAGTPGAPAAPAPASTPPSADLRQYATGDTWSWTLTGTMNLKGGQTLTMQNASMKQTVIDVALVNGHPRVSLGQSVTFQIPNRPQPIVVHDVSIYDVDPKDHSMALVSDAEGHNGSFRYVQGAPQMEYPGVWSAATTVNNQVHFTNGDWKTVDAHITGTAESVTPVGNFSAWLTTVTQQYSDNSGTTQTGSFVPGLGSWSDFDLTNKSADGTSMAIHGTLASTSVPTQGL